MSLVAYLMSREIVRLGYPQPKFLFLTASEGPATRTNEKKRYLLQRNELIEKLRSLGGISDTRLEKRLKEWRAQWADIDNVHFPKLYFSNIDGNDIVVDGSMQPQKIIHITSEEKMICENLNQRKNIAGLLGQLPDYTLEQLTEIVSGIFAKGLIFHESGTYMNLVADKEPVLKRSHKLIISIF